MSSTRGDGFNQKVEDKVTFADLVEDLEKLQEKDKKLHGNTLITFARSSDNHMIVTGIGIAIILGFWLGEVIFGVDLSAVKVPATFIFGFLMIFLVFNSILIPGYNNKIEDVLWEMTTTFNEEFKDDLKAFTKSTVKQNGNVSDFKMSNESTIAMNRMRSYHLEKKRSDDEERRRLDEEFFVLLHEVYKDTSPEVMFKEEAATGMFALLYAYSENMYFVKKSMKKDMLWMLGSYREELFIEIKRQYDVWGEGFSDNPDIVYLLCQELRNVVENQDAEGLPLEVLVHFAIVNDETGILTSRLEENDLG